MSLQEKINKIPPKKLFLIDSLGAVLSALMLGVVLVVFEDTFGMPQKTLYFLSLIACVFAVHSFWRFWRKSKNWKLNMKRIAIANLMYCLLTTGLVIYLQWVNDISGMHWFSLAPKDIKEKYVWVAIRHEIDYAKPAFLDEKLRIETWIETLEGVRSIRIVHIYRANVLLAKSRTTWCLLDAKTNRITRVTPEVQALFIK